MLIAISDCERDTVMLTNIISVNDISTATSSSDVSCFGNNDGQGSVTPTSGTPSYTYQWSANAGSQTTQTATSLSNGTYYVSTTDGNGCLAVDTVIINQPPLLSLSSTASPALCNGDANGSITAAAVGGTGTYTYDIGAGGQASASFSGLSLSLIHISEPTRPY